MASTYSNLKLELIGTGEQVGQWGATTNTNMGTALEEAVVGSADVTFASADVNLTLVDSNATQVARNYRLNLTGTSGGARNLFLSTGANIEKPYIINNNLADEVTVRNKIGGVASGTSVTVPAGKTMLLYNTGTNIVEQHNYTSVAAGGTGRDTLTLNNVILGNGTSAVQLVAPGTTGNVLKSDGTTWTSGPIPAAGSNTQVLYNNSGSAAGSSSFTFNSGTGAVSATSFAGSGASLTNLNASNIASGTLPVARGGTGATTLTGVLKGNGTSAVTASNVNLASEVTGTLPTANGGTNLTTYTSANNAIYSTSASALTAGTLPVAAGGTGRTTLATGGLVLGNGTSGLNTLVGSSIGQIPQWDGVTWGVGTLPSSGVTNVTASSPLSSSGGSTPNISFTGTLPVLNGGTGSTTSSGARTNLGASTVGSNMFTLTDPSAVTFPRFNANNTVSALDAASFRTAIGASSSNGTVTSVDISGGITGLTASGGPITTSGTFTLGGVLNLANGGTGSSTSSGARSNLGLGTMATQNSSSVSITGGSISGVSISGVPSLSGTNSWSGANTFTGGATSSSWNFSSTSSIYLSSSTVRVDISSSNVAIFDQSGGFSRLRLNNSNYGIQSDGSSTQWGVVSGTYAQITSGEFLVNTDSAKKPNGGLWVAYSDRQLKENISAYTKGLAQVKELNPVTFNFNDVTSLGKQTQYKTYTGLIAQDIEVTSFANTVNTGSDGYKNVDSSEITYALINAVKELSVQVDSLKAEIAALKGK